MKSYTVNQIAEMLGTNPETVRRWIRDKKLHAVQVSRKDGNIITESELERFVKATPKYLTRISKSLNISSYSPSTGIISLASSIIAGAILGFYEEKSEVDLRIRPEDFKEYLYDSIEKLSSSIIQKQILIRQTESEIVEMKRQIDNFKNLLDHEDLVEDILKNVEHEKEEIK